MESRPTSYEGTEVPRLREVMEQFGAQLNRFEQSARAEGIKSVPDYIFAFANYLEAESRTLFEMYQGKPNEEMDRGMYKLAQTVAKLDAFNRNNAAALRQYAELHSLGVDAALLERFAPGLQEVELRAQEYLSRESQEYTV